MIAKAKPYNLIPTASQYVVKELHRFAEVARGKRLRTRVEFAQDCIVLPEGPFRGFHWRPHYQPYSYHVLNMMDAEGYRRFRFSGCVQSGKTFLVVINVCYHLFERRETVIYGVPDVDQTGQDKWREELLPTIEESPFMRQFLPTKGRGSQGGFKGSITFTNGATLRFMSAQGGDHKRSHYTAPVVVKTEVDRYDTATESSRESSPVEQMEARTESFGSQAFSYEECTKTTETGRINSELEQSTNTRLYVQCVDCKQPVYPHREDLIGVEDANDIEEAAAEGAFRCPSCGILWSESERRTMVTVSGLTPVHRGQEIELDKNKQPAVVGEPVRTDRLGVTWHAFHNLFWDTAKICRDEFNALYSVNPDDADLNRRQFAWCLASEPEEFDVTGLTLASLTERFYDLPKGVVPPDTTHMSAGADLSAKQLHFVIRAWTNRDGVVEGHAIDIGSIEVKTARLGIRKALLEAMATLRDDVILPGYANQQGEKFVPQWTLIDAGWQTKIVWQFMAETALKGVKGFMPILGRGQSEPPGVGSYSHPKDVGGKVLWIGENCYIRMSGTNSPFFKSLGLTTAPMFVFANSDEWKTFVRFGFQTPEAQPGALWTFKETTKEERALLRQYRMQLLAEKVIRKVVPRRGPVDVYVNESRRANHYGDADYYSCVAGNVAGVVIEQVQRKTQRASVEKLEPLGTETPTGNKYV